MKPVPHKGQLKTWKDDRGFGFIQPSDAGKEVFLHISALKGASRRPKVGDTIFYELTTEANGKVRASNASIEGIAPQSFRDKNKRNATKHGLQKVIRIAIVGLIAIVAMKLSDSRSPEYSGSRSSSPNTFVTSVTKPRCNIKGNISVGTGNKIYHVLGGEDYESTRIEPASGEKWFCTEAEAIANGWRKSPR
ncbi:cold shock domain-containing protein [Coleofasciculus sp. FACHB-1120]|uniref:cold shock domain-containing protein n=1 Tax=Coleofasciculus sp. FACHB-1120 TaxID=2692783 RepID=UPI001684793D|nr:cold shock domain-containing protein [Coleofasciculus sp. FACHB-1120]MBD2744376.1 cold shock domain-containing protein [Coleofasciculus sp. FACHB-1120]